MMTSPWINGQQNSPAFRLTMDGADITQKLEKRLLSLTITDNRRAKLSGISPGGIS